MFIVVLGCLIVVNVVGVWILFYIGVLLVVFMFLLFFVVWFLCCLGIVMW